MDSLSKRTKRGQPDDHVASLPARSAIEGGLFYGGPDPGGIRSSLLLALGRGGVGLLLG